MRRLTDATKHGCGCGWQPGDTTHLPTLNPRPVSSPSAPTAAWWPRRCAQAAGLSVDDVAPRLSFFFAVGMEFFSEVREQGLAACTPCAGLGVQLAAPAGRHATALAQAHGQPPTAARAPSVRQVAKLRAARRLWARLVKDKFKPADQRSLQLRTHCQVGWGAGTRAPARRLGRGGWRPAACSLQRSCLPQPEPGWVGRGGRAAVPPAGRALPLRSASHTQPPAPWPRPLPLPLAQTSGYSLTAQEPYNNIIRTTVEVRCCEGAGGRLRSEPQARSAASGACSSRAVCPRDAPLLLACAPAGHGRSAGRHAVASHQLVRRGEC